MQIRLTVLGPRSGHSTRACDVLVTAPAGTALSAVASSLAAAVAGAGADVGGAGAGSGPVVLYAGQERLDLQRAALGEPPLIDGAVLSLQSPGPAPAHGLPAGPARLRVVSGPDAGGVHLLHGGQIRIGRSADADVPLDDPDVSRMHCSVTVAPDGAVTVADLHSTNGTAVDGTEIDDHPAPLPPGALLRIGESALRLQPSPASPDATLPATPDGEGRLRVHPADGGAPSGEEHHPSPGGPVTPYGAAGSALSHGARSAAPYTASTSASYGSGRYPSGAGPAAGPAAGSGSAQEVHGAAGPYRAGTAGAGAYGAFPADAYGARPSATAAPYGTRQPTTGPDDRHAAGPYGGAPGTERYGNTPGTGSYGSTPGTGSYGSTPGTGSYGSTPGTEPRGSTPAPGSYEARTYEAGTPGAEAYAAETPAYAPDARAAGRPNPDRYAPTAPEEQHAPQHGQQHPGAQHGHTYGAHPGQPAGDAYGHPTDGAPAGQSGPRNPAAGRRGTPVRGTPATAAGFGTGPDAHGGAPRPDAHGGPTAREGHEGRAPAGPPAPDPRSAATHGGREQLVGPFAQPDADPEADAGASPSRKATRRGGLSAWARRLAGGRGTVESAADEEAAREAGGYGAAAQVPAADVPGPLAADARDPAAHERWPDAATVLLTALGPGPRLWERDAEHPDALAVRLGTADRAGGRAAVPVTVGLRSAGSLGMAGPRPRLAGLARSAVAQLAALHAPGTLEIVLLAADRTRTTAQRLEEWSWLGWLPHVRPAHAQDCRLLLAYDKDQVAARTTELVRRLDDGPLGPGWASAERSAVAAAATRHHGPYTLVIADGDPGTSGLRETVARLAAGGPSVGIHVLALAETPSASPVYPLAATYETARTASPAFGECGAVAVLSGDVATALRVVQPLAPLAPAAQGAAVTGSIAVNGVPQSVAGSHGAGTNGTVATVDAVSLPWAERFARALAPLREAESVRAGRGARTAVPLPDTTRLLDEMGLARATPASLMARWAATADSEEPSAPAVLGAGPHGPVHADPAADGCHFLLEGGPGTGKTELLRSIAASLAAADRPDRLSLVLVDGAGTERGDGLRLCTDLPHVTAHLAASDPVRMREFAQALSSELKRRAEILGDTGFAEWRAKHLAAPRVIGPRRSAEGRTATAGGATSAAPAAAAGATGYDSGADRSGLLDAPATSTLRLRPRERTQGTQGTEGAEAPRADGFAAVPPMTRLFVLVDDFDALVAPALGSTGRPAAGSVVRALEAVARDGAALGVHLIATTGHPDRTAATATAERAGLRVELSTETVDPAEPLPVGRGRLFRAADGSATPFQAGRVTGRIPRTSTLRPTVVPLEWQRMGDPPARRPLRELGNGPTDLALLASALQKAAKSVS
ncbi:FHA domain-containing protein [Streptomyces niger]|uniref:FHA domain-containing protein n=1 Tax=Streptomyces niger TaxID=66373 RepID=UPI00069BBD87|nr:FHA domain-containing protein [Streptomyces niger]